MELNQALVLQILEQVELANQLVHPIRDNPDHLILVHQELKMILVVREQELIMLLVAQILTLVEHLIQDLRMDQLQQHKDQTLLKILGLLIKVLQDLQTRVQVVRQLLQAHLIQEQLGPQTLDQVKVNQWKMDLMGGTHFLIMRVAVEKRVQAE